MYRLDKTGLLPDSNRWPYRSLTQRQDVTHYRLLRTSKIANFK
ncbi:hypothetical protein [Paenibacillus solanacearum]|nr:hypothetical protein [Paenibacillus solanacearum]